MFGTEKNNNELKNELYIYILYKNWERER